MIEAAMRRAERIPFLYLSGNGLILGAILGDPDSLSWFLVVLGLGLAVSVTGAGYSIRASGGTERRLRDEVRAGSAELVPAREAELAPAMVVRTRPAVRHPSFVAGTSGEVHPTSVVTMLIALAGDGPRLVVALVPPEIGLRLERKQVVGVRLHPARPDVAVLDPGLDAGQLAQFDTDPRWSSETMPSTGARRTVLFAAAGLVAGVAVGAVLAGLG